MPRSGWSVRCSAGPPESPHIRGVSDSPTGAWLRSRNAVFTVRGLWPDSGGSRTVWVAELQKPPPPASLVRLRGSALKQCAYGTGVINDDRSPQGGSAPDRGE